MGNQAAVAIINLRTGNLFETDDKVLVNAVNCVGAIGRGIALQFKNRFPANFREYAGLADSVGSRCGRASRLHFVTCRTSEW